MFEKVGGRDAIDAVYVFPISDWRGAAVLGFFGVEEPGDGERATWWSGEYCEEFAGLTTPKQVVIDVVSRDVVILPPVLWIVVE